MIAAKGPNIMDMEERCALAKACKWVDEVFVLIIGLTRCSLHSFIRNFRLI